MSVVLQNPVAEQALKPIDIPYAVWSPAGLDNNVGTPLMLVNDGPEFGSRSNLLSYLDRQIEATALPPLRVALLEPTFGKRNEWYGASAEYNAAVIDKVLPAITESYSTAPRIIGMGASLGAISMLDIAMQNPGVVHGLFLQSGSYHHPKLDIEPGGYDEYQRVAGLVDTILHTEKTPASMEITLTCGRREANLVGNIVMYNALKSQGHKVDFIDTLGGHSFECWGELFEPHLKDLIKRAIK